MNWLDGIFFVGVIFGLFGLFFAGLGLLADAYVRWTNRRKDP
jgi:multisubunit Na+/H+ antiporter MnhG subunit